MANSTIEKRLSIVEAELTEIKRRLGENLLLPNPINVDKNTHSDPSLKPLTIAERFAAIRAKDPSAWSNLPKDLAEQHDHYIYGWPKK